MKLLWRNHAFKNLLRVVVGGIVLTIMFFLGISFFKITTIHVEPENISVSLDSTQLPSNLIFFPADKLRNVLLKEYPRVKDAQFTKDFPHTLNIILTLREPVAFVSEGDTILAIDSEGILFSAKEASVLPKLELPIDAMTPGKKAEGRGVKTSLAFLKKLSHDEQVEHITLSNDSTLEVMGKDLHVLLLAEADGTEQADTLQALLKGFRMKGSVPHTIDLRFSKPIITP